MYNYYVKTTMFVSISLNLYKCIAISIAACAVCVNANALELRTKLVIVCMYSETVHNPVPKLREVNCFVA